MLNSMKVFISHSSKDKPFARKLDAALVSNGVDVFLDEKEIKIGDSIPDAIYEALERSTHVIYVISSNSVDSKWVSEELAIAKMKEKSDSGIKILPCIIDDVDIPFGVKHVKYCNCLKWYDYSEFTQSVKQILDALGVPLKQPEDIETVFYIKNIIYFNDVERLSDNVASAIYAARNVRQGFLPDSLIDLVRFLTKMVIIKPEVDSLELLIDRVYELEFNNESSLKNLADKMNKFLGCLSYKRDEPDVFLIQEHNIESAENISSEISGMLKDFRMKVTEPIFSSYSV